MTDTFKETTHVSYGKKIKDSLIGVVVGIVLTLGSCAGLWWNEGHSVDRIRALDEGRAAVVSVDPASIDNVHEGQLIHFSGKAQTDATLQDSIFNISVPALKLKRTVSMYQWDEKKDTKTKKEIGGGESQETTYTYNKTWSNKVINSNQFKYVSGHENPQSMPFSSQEWVASSIHVGAFQLNTAFTDQIDQYQKYPITDQDVQKLSPHIQAKYKRDGSSLATGTLEKPVIGDVQISFDFVDPLDVSVVGKQMGHTVVPYMTKTGSLSLLEQKIMDAPAMFAAAETENTIMTWIFRVVGFVALWMGLALILGPLKTLADVLPFLGSVVGAGMAGITGLAALVVSMVIVASAWLFYRPIIGGSILVLAVLMFILGHQRLKRKSLPPSATTPTVS